MTTFPNGHKPTLILAGQRAAFTKALQAYSTTEDEEKKHVAAVKMAEIIDRAPAKGFTKDQVTQGPDIPGEVMVLLHSPDAMPERAEVQPENPTMLVNELQQTVDTSDQRVVGSGEQYVYAYGYRCAPDRLKVGRTDRDVITRVASQINTSTPDKPVIQLVIRTDDCRGLEMAMHGFLRVRRRWVVGGGDEWYLTTRDELLEIYGAIVGRGAASREVGNGMSILPPSE